MPFLGSYLLFVAIGITLLQRGFVFGSILNLQAQNKEFSVGIFLIEELGWKETNPFYSNTKTAAKRIDIFAAANVCCSLDQFSVFLSFLTSNTTSQKIPVLD